MIISYKCVNRECPLYDEPIPDVRTLRADDGKGRVCSSCGEKMRRRDDKCLGRGSAEERREPPFQTLSGKRTAVRQHSAEATRRHKGEPPGLAHRCRTQAHLWRHLVDSQVCRPIRAERRSGLERVLGSRVILDKGRERPGFDA